MPSSTSTTLRSSHNIWVTLAAATAAVSGIVWLYYHRDRRRRRDSSVPNNDNNVKEEDDDALPSLPSHIERDMHKEERFRRMVPLLTMKKPMYDNIMMQDPQGNPLATVSSKKARWYVNKGLADWIVQKKNDDRTKQNGQRTHLPQSPKQRQEREQQPQSIIRLRFQPNNNQGLDAAQVEYNTTVKANRCVVCGATDRYMRHYVVPSVYRTLFPDAYKTHLGHDVVLTCASCHVRAERHVSRRRRRLEEAVVRTDPTTTTTPVIVDRRRRDLVKEARALLRRRRQMPQWRVAECQAHIRAYWRSSSDDDDDGSGDDDDDNRPEDLPTDLLVKTSQLECTIPNPHYVPGPVLVVRPLLEALEVTGSDRALADFVRDWRAFFVETSRPRYLPAGWSVDSPVMCDTRDGDGHRRDQRERQRQQQQ